MCRLQRGTAGGSRPVGPVRFSLCLFPFFSSRTRPSYNLTAQSLPGYFCPIVWGRWDRSPFDLLHYMDPGPRQRELPSAVIHDQCTSCHHTVPQATPLNLTQVRQSRRTNRGSSGTNPFNPVNLSQMRVTQELASGEVAPTHLSVPPNT